ncbi:hypothetical protein BJ973_001219 [Actinoplanes tereljensis]|uniref:Uncharacterized protein n=1 Tax=Paractinoplanes tereljensis TaxID=571912 RepID=A0A919NLA3_9ACTN|nr:hypothetical protein [Actinoplanes tereljensis]GIF20874.1 hypothetical protein Ate02nite_36040 [Actinoplanes tereljensis]
MVPVLLTSASPCTAPSTLAFNSGRILAACQAPNHGLALSATDLSVTGTFGSNDQPPVGIAGSAEGSTVAVATTTNYAPTVWVDAAYGSALRNHPLPAGETIDFRGVAVSGDGTTAYAVSHLSHAYTVHLRPGPGRRDRGGLPQVHRRTAGSGPKELRLR